MPSSPEFESRRPLLLSRVINYPLTLLDQSRATPSHSNASSTAKQILATGRASETDEKLRVLTSGENCELQETPAAQRLVPLPALQSNRPEQPAPSSTRSSTRVYLVQFDKPHRSVRLLTYSKPYTICRTRPWQGSSASKKQSLLKQSSSKTAARAQHALQRCCYFDQYETLVRHQQSNQRPACAAASARQPNSICNDFRCCDRLSPLARACSANDGTKPERTASMLTLNELTSSPSPVPKSANFPLVPVRIIHIGCLTLELSQTTEPLMITIH